MIISEKSHFRITSKEIIFLILMWFLFYIEPLSIGVLKISQIWKAVVLMVILIYLFGKEISIFAWFGFLFAFKYLVYSKMPYGYLYAIQSCLEALIFPTFLSFFYLRYKDDKLSASKLHNIALLIAIFIIYSTIPFLLGVKSLNPASSLERYGLESSAITGLFYSIASSSKLYVVSTILLINSFNYFKTTVYSKLFWLVSIMLGGYFILFSWTRTGWFIFLAVLLISLFYKSDFKRKVISLSIIGLLFISVLWLYDSNQAFRYRLTGGATYRTDTELSVEQLASARVPFMKVAIDNLKNEKFVDVLFGYGTQYGIDLFFQKTGMAIVSHNATFDMLQSSGIIGLLFYLFFILLLFKKVLIGL
ncbi:MAG: hypothetical protein VB048_01235, partial [Bacteroidaceae bacterium]|nr:hypothetical protein [Bacteroidaceae bacterium]